MGFNERKSFLTVLEAGLSKIRKPALLFPIRTVSVACGWLHSCMTRQKHERKIALSSSYEDTNHIVMLKTHGLI